MLRHVEAHRLDAAIDTVQQALPLPAFLGRLCHRPCENGCRRGTHDQPAAIRDVERFVADHNLASPNPRLPPRKKPTGKTVAIVGAGPAGLAAAYFLLREGHRVTVFDRHTAPGGSLRRELDARTLDPATFDGEMDRLRALGATFSLGAGLGRDLALDSLLARFNAVLLALGESGKAQAQALGLATAPTGIKTDPDSALTNQPRVHAAGAAARPLRQLVRALADGRAAARSIHRSLLDLKPHPTDRLFSSVMGRLDPTELNQFLIGPSPGPRLTPALGSARGFLLPEAGDESRRCLHCDCRAEGHCQLQHYAQLYGAEAGRFRAQRRPFEQHLQHGEIIFEPGKCILCGLCVRIAEQASEPLGLAFIGRGFDVRVAAPFNRSIAEGLQKVGRDCVDACPTGALALKQPAPA
jgi:ferredoxin